MPVTEAQPKTAKSMKRFQVLVGRHVHGYMRTDPDTGDITSVTAEEKAENPAGVKPAPYYKDGPLGDIVETDRNLLRFNKPGSTKFKLLALGESPVADVNDGLEEMTVPDLRSYAQDLELELPEDVKRKGDIIKEIRVAMARA
tara:strand:+ start:60736 stop:61164 length:429 start_codon:yes stop_codon:yes gene_type:complete